MNIFNNLQFLAFFLLIMAGGEKSTAYALEAKEILVVANTRITESIDIAKYYMESRAIPSSHLVRVALTLQESMSRDEYDNLLKGVVLNALQRVSPQRIAAIVLIYGVPLKVQSPELTWEESEEVQRYKKYVDGVTAQSVIDNGKGKKKDLLQHINMLLKTDEKAAVDSELALVKVSNYKLQGWIKNPYFLGFQEGPVDIVKDDVLLVCRLDGPDPATVYRIINDTLQAEKLGLRGKAYFDARWPRPEEVGNALGGYQRYDLSLHRAADAVAPRLTTILDKHEELLSENCCPDTALYCGWYSLAHYKDSFVWNKGSIGYHIASAECETLKDRRSSVWCLKMLEKGVAATIGPVFEPYVQGFPPPELFFRQLVEGDLSLGESYLTSLPYLSWQMVLIGDPMYQPFLNTK